MTVLHLTGGLLNVTLNGTINQIFTTSDRWVTEDPVVTSVGVAFSNCGADTVLTQNLEGRMDRWRETFGGKKNKFTFNHK